MHRLLKHFASASQRVSHSLPLPFSRSLSTSSSSSGREVLNYDTVIVGAGPAGLSAAIRLRQRSPELSVCVLEKGSEVGAHILSGNVLEPRALDELLPDWRELPDAPTNAPVSKDQFQLLTKNLVVPLPIPSSLKNDGNYVISLSKATRWLASIAEDLGVEIYPGFSCSELLYMKNGAVKGVATKDFGVGKNGKPKENYQQGIEIHARATLLAEGARGSLTKMAEKHFGLRIGKTQGQTYGLGLKEVWRVPGSSASSLGNVLHTVGYPLMESGTYGGGFVYHMEEDLISVGLIVGLDYKNPFSSPYAEFQRFKEHPSVYRILQKGEPVQYGARVINEGGLQCIPNLSFPGGALVGCAAGFVNVAKIKGTHTAMKSGMLAADVAAEQLGSDKNDDVVDMSDYENRIKNSWIWEELSRARNIRPAFQYGFVPGLANAAFETFISRGRTPWTIKHAHHGDHLATEPAHRYSEKNYSMNKEGKVSFDILNAVALSGTNHDHDEECHLRLKDEKVPENVNLAVYGGLEGRYCPAKVYEYVEEEDRKKLTINPQNCLHCKACDVKDPQQNITWTVPQGGGGPKYTVM